jgi:3-vinyl bacteriochlorophyllide hydratase
LTARAALAYSRWRRASGPQRREHRPTKGTAIVTSNSRPAPVLYTPEQRRRRDETPWTLVQGLLAPAQFLVFLVSLVLVLRTLLTGEGLAAASASVVVKTLFLYAIMVTGAIWEKRVFGVYLFAAPFYWEDVFSMLVIALHTGYLVALFGGYLGARGQLLLALAAFATYVVNATQFILKLRAARLGQQALEQAALQGVTE